MTQPLSGVPNWNAIAVGKYNLPPANQKTGNTQQPPIVPSTAETPIKRLAHDKVSFGGNEPSQEMPEYLYQNSGKYPAFSEKDSGGISFTTLAIGALALGGAIWGLRKGKFDGLINKIAGTNFYQNHLKGGRIANWTKKAVEFIKPKNAAETVKTATPTGVPKLDVSNAAAQGPNPTKIFRETYGSGDII